MFRRSNLELPILVFIIALLNWSGVLSQTSTVNLTLFRDVDSLTIYIPGNQFISLRGLRLESETASGARVGRALEAYPAFRGLDFGAVLPPICFRIEREGSRRTLPLDCQTANTLKQIVPDADVFWYDEIANSQRLVLLLRDGVIETPDFCPVGQNRCDMSYIPPIPTPTMTPTPTLTPTVTLTPSLNPSSTLTPTEVPTQVGTPTGGGRGQIAFVSYPSIYISNADGSSVRQLTDPDIIDHAIQPAWSPDGMHIAFMSDDEIFVMNADGGDIRRITNHPARDLDPAWSPDGLKIAFTSTRGDGFSNIYIMNADGSDVRRLTDFPNDMRPVWSPDGTTIAFDRIPDRKWDIHVMNADGSNVRRLTHRAPPGFDSEAAWSPDGQRIAFVSGLDDVSEIYVMNADGSDIRRLTNNSNLSKGPAWSPDGTKIAFETWEDETIQIYVMDDDGSNLHRLTNDPERTWDAAWRP